MATRKSGRNESSPARRLIWLQNLRSVVKRELGFYMVLKFFLIHFLQIIYYYFLNYYLFIYLLFSFG